MWSCACPLVLSHWSVFRSVLNSCRFQHRRVLWPGGLWASFCRWSGLSVHFSQSFVGRACNHFVFWCYVGLAATWEYIQVFSFSHCLCCVSCTSLSHSRTHTRLYWCVCVHIQYSHYWFTGIHSACLCWIFTSLFKINICVGWFKGCGSHWSTLQSQFCGLSFPANLVKWWQFWLSSLCCFSRRWSADWSWSVLVLYYLDPPVVAMETHVITWQYVCHVVELSC